MAKYRLDIVAELARQLEFTPTETRSAQVASAELLLHDIDPNKAYPADFVVYRITGYHPKTSLADQLTGLALQHDLGLLIEQVSDSLDVQTVEVNEPVLAIDDVTEKFNVTSKTIQRWRRKGLPARRFLFPDGKRRVGFLLSSVERFVTAHGQQVALSANFTQVDEAEKREIFRRARRLATQCRCCTNEITRRIGRKLNRSPLTILHTIRKHDEEDPRNAIFPLAAAPLTEEDRSKLVKANRRGLSIAQLAKRACRPRSAIYRVLLEERWAKIAKRNVNFIDDPLYHLGEADLAMEAITRGDELVTLPIAEANRVPKDLPAHLAELYRTPLLSPGRERALFIDFNYRKFQFVVARRRIEPQSVRARDLNHLERLYKRAVEVKNQIVRANLRLVVSVAKCHLRPGLDLTELLSDGYVTLMRAVESFNIHKGNRFSTYATFALMKGYARSVPMMIASRRYLTGDAEILGSVPDTRMTSDRAMFDREQVKHLLGRLEPREREVLLAHYGLSGGGAVTLEQVGRQMGLTKQRVRQIEQEALAKLRGMAEEPVLRGATRLVR